MLFLVLLISTTTLSAAIGGERAKNVTDLGKGLQKVTWYYDNGSVSEEGFYMNGSKHGTWISYSENGEKSGVVNWNDDKKDGDCLIYDAEGKLKYKVVYSSNKKVNAEEY